MAAKSGRLQKLLPLIVLSVAIVGTLLYMQQRKKPKEVVLSGTLEARTVNVGSLFGGRVTRVLVDEGSPVQPGQVVLVLESETVDRQIAEQRSAIDAARAQLARVIAGPRSEEREKAAVIAQNDERQRRRLAELLHQGIVSRQQYEDAATRAKASSEEKQIVAKGSRQEDIASQKAMVEQQERRLDTLLKQRSETEVRSTVAGVVQSFGLRPGDLVAPNQSVAEILEADQIWVRVYVPETMLGLVHVGQPARIKVDSFQNETFPGHISTINSKGEYTPRNVQTRSQRAEQVYAVKVLVDPNPKLKAGMAADVDFGVKGRAE